jgi:hypothetical protein
MTDKGFCVVAALSRYTTRVLSVSFRNAGKSLRILPSNRLNLKDEQTTNNVQTRLNCRAIFKVALRARIDESCSFGECSKKSAARFFHLPLRGSTIMCESVMRGGEERSETQRDVYTLLCVIKHDITRYNNTPFQHVSSNR